MKTLMLLGALFLTTSAAMAQTSYYRNINFNFTNTRNNSSRQECVRKVLGNCVQWRTVENRRTVAAWTDTQKATAKRALTIVAQRMLKPAVTRCALDNAKKSFTSGAPFSLPSYSDVRNFVWGQNRALLERGFPNVTVQLNVLGNNFAGQAQVGNFVDARNTDHGTVVRGSYNFEMNRDTMNTVSDLQIAGVMAHEMLHQMSHSHPNGYDDENFVVVFQNCMVNDGSYARPGFGLLPSGQRGVLPIKSCGAR